MVACIQPNLSSGEAVGWPRIPDRPGSWRFVLDGFMTPWSFDAFGSGSYASRRVGFSGPTMVLSETRGLQLFWVMRGGIRCIWRLGAERRTQGLAHRLILSLDPERRKNRLANHRVNKPGLAWSCRRSSCLRFQMFCVETSSFFPKCQRDGRDLACEREASHFRLHSPGQQSCVKILQWSRATTGAQGRTFEDPLHLVVVILIQTTDLLWLFGTLQLSVHITMLRTVVRLHPQTTVGPQLPLATEPVGRLHQGQQQGSPQRANQGNLAQYFHGLMFPALG